MNYKKIAAAIGILLILILGGFVIWASFPLGPSSDAVKALQSTSTVTVSTDPFLTFKPAGKQATTGLIFYPGGHVDARSYAPLAAMIAAQGYLVVIAPMTLNLAVFSPNRADKVMATYPDIDTWTMAGHSLGGSMTCKYVYDHPGTIKALYLLASYPANSNNLTGYTLDVISLYGSHDQVLSVNMNDTLQLLPATAQLMVIAGGNHAYFGNYGPQPGDGTATISRLEQQNFTVNTITASLQQFQ